MTEVSPSSWLQGGADLLDPDKATMETTYLGWMANNLPNMFPSDFGPQHRWISDQLQIDPHGLRAWEAAFRGGGKTTFTSVGLPLAAIALGTHKFPLIISSTQLEGEARLDAIRAVLDDERIQQKYPRLRYVTQARSARKRRQDTSREILLVGGRILVLGVGARIRGILRDSSDGDGKVALIRPDLVLLDDIEDDAQARSKLLTERLENWIFADVVGLGAHQNPVSIIGIGTPLSMDSITNRAIQNRGRFKGWQTKRFPAVYTNEKGSERPTWPEGMPWGRIKSLRDPESDEFVGNFVWAREYLCDPQNVNGAMWTEELIADARYEAELPKMKVTIVSVDPSWGKTRDECGIIVAGLGVDNKCYLIADLSTRSTPLEWGKVVKQAFYDYKCQYVIAEAAFGAENVNLVMGQVDPKIPFKTVRSKMDKERRFEPIVMLYEKGRVKHAKPLTLMENQMLTWVQGESHFSPDRADAMAWACWYLLLKGGMAPARLVSPAKAVEMVAKKQQAEAKAAREEVPAGLLGRAVDIDGRPEKKPKRRRMVY